MKRKASVFLLLIAAAAMLSMGEDGSPSPRNGRFGLSGIARDKSALGGLPIDITRTGFFIGPSAGFVGSNKEGLHTRRMRELVSCGVTPIANVYAGDVAEGNGAALAEIVAYYTSGEGAKEVGTPIVYWEIGNEENGGWGTSCPPEEFARRGAILAGGTGEVEQSESDQAADPVKRYVLLWGLGVEKVLWQDRWVREGPLWIGGPGGMTVEDITGKVLGVHSGPFRLDLGIEPVYLIGDLSSFSTSPPKLRSTDGD